MKQALAMVIVLVAGGATGACAQAPDADDNARPLAEGIPDALRMPAPRQLRAQRFWATLERCVNKPPEFEITVKVKEFGLPGTKEYGRTYTYAVKLPDFMAAGLPGLRKSDQEPFLEKLLTEALLDERYSYYAALLAIHAGYNYLSWPVDLLDRNKWRENCQKYARYWIDDRWGGFQHTPERYRRWLYLQALSAGHRKELGVQRGTLLESRDSMPRHRLLRSNMAEKGHKGAGLERQLAIGDAITAYAEKADASELEKLPHDRKTLLIWCAHLVNDEGKDFAMTANAFLRYAKAHKHPALCTDMALAAFVVRGYEYDGKKGRYELNEVGKRLIEYAVEHPIPEALPVLDILKKRWDEEAVTKLIEKHHPDAPTWEKFKEEGFQ